MLTCLINQYHFSLLIYLISVFATWPCCCFIAISVFSLSIGKAISCSQWSWKLFWKWHFVVNHQQREGKKSGVFLNGSTCQIKHCFVQRMKVEPKNIVIFIPVHPNDTFCYFARIASTFWWDGCVTDFTTLSSCKPWKKKACTTAFKLLHLFNGKVPLSWYDVPYFSLHHACTNSHLCCRGAF